jgi:transcriptional regulator with XRE-family HTH domain
MKSYDFKKLLGKKLKNPEFRKEWEAQKEEFEVAKEVIRLRIKAGITQKELAEKAYTSQPAIARLESGNYRNLNLSFLRKIGKALGADPHVRFKRIKPVLRKDTIARRPLSTF